MKREFRIFTALRAKKKTTNAAHELLHNSSFQVSTFIICFPELLPGT